MSTNTDYQRLRAATTDAKEFKQEEEKKSRGRERAEDIKTTGERKIQEGAENQYARPQGTATSAYFRRMEQRSMLIDRKVEQIEAKQKEQQSRPRDQIAECAGRCVSATLRAIASPFIWAGNGIARAFGCKK